MFKFFAVLIGTIALAWGTNGDDIGAGPERKFYYVFMQWSALYTKLSRVKLLFGGCPVKILRFTEALLYWNDIL